MGLRIGLVTPRYHPSVLGGAELHARWLADQLGHLGHEVDVLTTCAISSHTWENVLPPGTERFGSVTVYRYPVDPCDHEIRSEIDRSIHEGAAFTLEEEEDFWLRNGVCSSAMEHALATSEDHFDLVVGLPYLAGTTYFAFRAVTDRFCLIPCLHEEAYAYMTFTRLMLTEARCLMFNTVPEMELAGSIVSEMARSAVVGLGLEPPGPVDPEDFRRRYGLNGPFAAFVGRLEDAKNLPLLIQYFLHYKTRRGGDLSLLLIGDGEVQPPRGRDVQKLAIDWADRDAMLTAASVLFQPSLKESFSIVMMQAWLCGTPVLVHAAGRVTTYHCRQSNGGLWFSDYPEFEAMLDRVLTDRQLATRLGASGRKYVTREYGWPTVLGRFQAAIEKCGARGCWPSSGQASVRSDGLA